MTPSTSPMSWKCGSHESDRRERGERGGVRGERRKAVESLVGPGRGGRDRDDTGIQASEERLDEFEAGRVEEQGALASQTLVEKPRCNGPRADVEFGERQLRP